MDLKTRMDNAKEESSKKVYKVQLDANDALFKEINEIKRESNIPILKQTDEQFINGDWKFGGKRKDIVDGWVKETKNVVGKGKKFNTLEDAKKEINNMAKNVKGIDDERYRVLTMVANKL